MGEQQPSLGPPDPAWARRIAKIEKKFVKAEKRQAAHTGPRRAGRGVRTAYASATVVVLVLVIAAVVRPFGDRSPAAGPAVPGIIGGPYAMGSATARTTSSATTSARFTVTVPAAAAADPFAGTPAATWRVGDVGVVMPVATALGPYPADQVRQGLEQARRYIVTARTDRSVLVDHRLQTLEVLLDPRQVAANRAVSAEPDSYLTPTLLAPGFALAAPARVSGSVTVAQVDPTGGAPDRHLVVKANLVWAYALVPHTDTRPGSGLVVLHEHLVLDVVPASPGPATLRVQSEDRYQSNIDCGYLAQGLIALPRVDDPSASPTTSGTVPTGTQVYDPRTPLMHGTTCR